MHPRLDRDRVARLARLSTSRQEEDQYRLHYLRSMRPPCRRWRRLFRLYIKLLVRLPRYRPLLSRLSRRRHSRSTLPCNRLHVPDRLCEQYRWDMDTHILRRGKEG